MTKINVIKNVIRFTVILTKCDSIEIELNYNANNVMGNSK